MQSAEPFFEAVGPARDVVGATAYRVGYRIQGTGDVLSVIEISAEIVEEAVTSRLSISVTMSPSGELAAATGAFSSAHARPDSTPVAIDVLVAQVAAAENLRLEEAAPEDLRTLLSRLERSVTIVNDALTRWGAP